MLMPTATARADKFLKSRSWVLSPPNYGFDRLFGMTVAMSSAITGTAPMRHIVAHGRRPLRYRFYHLRLMGWSVHRINVELIGGNNCTTVTKGVFLSSGK
jgi:hypothetical protein